ncbi:MAG TPA: ribokinase [Naasia sp.]
MPEGNARPDQQADREAPVDVPASVLIVGSASADLTTFSERLPRPGETVRGDDFTLVLGGKGANQAVAVGRAGAPARMVGCIGSDLFADMVSDALGAAGVDLTFVRRVPGPTGIAHIRVDGSGENDIVIVPLANSALSEEQIDAAFDGGAPASVLLTQLEIPLPLARYALRRARDAGMTTVLDPAPAAELPDDVWPLLDIVTPNESEATVITGIPVRDAESATAAGRWFLDRGVGSALITLAGAGAVLVDAEGSRSFPVFPVVPVDTTAAGDAFAGYLGAALALGSPLGDAVTVAMAAGALAVTRRGASPSIPMRAEVDALLARHSAR